MYLCSDLTVQGQHCGPGYSLPLWGLKRRSLCPTIHATSCQTQASFAGNAQAIVFAPQRRRFERLRSCSEILRWLRAALLWQFSFMLGPQLPQLRANKDNFQRKTMQQLNRQAENSAFDSFMDSEVLYIWLIVKGTRSASQSVRAIHSVILKIGRSLVALSSLLLDSLSRAWVSWTRIQLCLRSQLLAVCVQLSLSMSA